MKQLLLLEWFCQVLWFPAYSVLDFLKQDTPCVWVLVISYLIILSHVEEIDMEQGKQELI